MDHRDVCSFFSRKPEMTFIDAILNLYSVSGMITEYTDLMEIKMNAEKSMSDMRDKVRSSPVVSPFNVYGGPGIEDRI